MVFPSNQVFGLTTIYRDINLLKERLEKVREQKSKSIVVFRGLPGSDKSNLVNSLDNVNVFSLTNYLGKNNNSVYSTDDIKKAHTNMRRDIINLLNNEKSLNPIIVDAPHSYLWELKYYRVQSAQHLTQFIVFECRTLFSKNNEIRTKQLADCNINIMIPELIERLSQSPKDKLLPSQTKLLYYLTRPNAVKVLENTKSQNNSFCPTVLLNIQLTAWLTSRTNNINMETIWNMLSEWEEITNDTELWKCKTPTWGY